MRIELILLGVAASFAASANLRADVPIPPPTDYEVQSASGRYVAKMTVDPPSTTVYEEREGKRVAVWAIQIFHPRVFLSDDGEHLAGVFNHLLPIPYSPDMVIIHFVEQGRTIREVTLHDLMPDLSKIVRTASHYDWGEFGDLNKKEEIVVETVDYRELRFDLKTGRLNHSGIRYQDWLDRFLAAIVASFAIATALLLLELWAIGSLANLGDEWTLGSYNWVTGLAMIWLIPGVLAAAVIGIVWRLVRRRRQLVPS